MKIELHWASEITSEAWVKVYVYSLKLSLTLI